MLYTLDQARTAVKRFVDNGSCNNTVIDARVNEALERLTDNVDLECMRAVIRILVCDRSFTLPYNVEKLLFADVNGTPAKLFGQPYQFLSSGPGDLDFRTSGSWFKDILDQGDFPMMFDIPKCYTWPVDGVDTTFDVSTTGLKLFAVSTSSADTSLSLRVRGHIPNGEMVGASTGSQGEAIPINYWQGGVEGSLAGLWGIDLHTSASRFSDILEIIKPETTGYITLYAVDVSNSRLAPKAFFAFLGKYHPRQTIPQFRRYAITNNTVACAYDSSYTADNCYGNAILALVKMRCVPLVDADDILPIDSLQALKLMVMAIREENAGNLQGSANLEGQAVSVMLKREKSRLQSDGVPAILNVDYRCSLGRHLNRRGLIM